MTRPPVRIHGINRPPPQLVDRFGRPLVVGGQYEVHDPLPQVYAITEITPDMRPGAAAGAWIVRMQAELVATVYDGLAASILTLVQLPQEATRETNPKAADPASEDPSQPPAVATTEGDRLIEEMDRTGREGLNTTKETGETNHRDLKTSPPDPADMPRRTH